MVIAGVLAIRRGVTWPLFIVDLWFVAFAALLFGPERSGGGDPTLTEDLFWDGLDGLGGPQVAVGAVWLLAGVVGAIGLLGLRRAHRDRARRTAASTSAR